MGAPPPRRTRLGEGPTTAPAQGPHIRCGQHGAAWRHKRGRRLTGEIVGDVEALPPGTGDDQVRTDLLEAALEQRGRVRDDHRTIAQGQRDQRVTLA
jgi:hypothetical protein